MKGKKKTLHKRKKETKVTCAICRGVVRKVNKKTSVKFPRKFGSTLCNKCARLISNYAERAKKGTLKLENLNLSYQKYVSALLKKK